MSNEIEHQMKSMDIESAAVQSTSTHRPVQRAAYTHKGLEQLDRVREENKSLKEELQRLTNSAAPSREASVDVCRGLATTMMIIDKYIAR